jgi:hypothetical protein
MTGIAGQAIGIDAQSTTPIGGDVAVDAESRGCMENFIGFIPAVPVQDPLPHDFVATDDTVTAASDGTTRFAPLYVVNSLLWTDGVDTLPINVVAPVVSGIGAVGETLTTDDGTWIGEAPITYTYQWYVDENTPIFLQTENTYVVGVAMEGSNISCTVTATNTKGTTSASSSNDIHIPAP